ncbi:MAG: hypothetical protein IIA67_01930, partial [Planctomycetes bacterium]|nr:hypothetical protein [Planctomycetota bacterium]
WHLHLPICWRGGVDTIAVLCLAVVLTAAGCGSGAYQEQFDKALSEQQQRSDEVGKFDNAISQLQAERQLISGNWPQLSLRRPNAFISADAKSAAQVYIKGDPHRYDKGMIVPNRLHPPFMATAETEIPGFLRCYESLVSGNDGEDDKQFTPYYMYVAVVPAVQAAPDDAPDAPVDNSPAADIHARLTAGLGFDPGDWEEIECMREEWDDDSAAKLSWKRLSVEAEQEFLVYKNEKEPAVAEMLSGRFDVCLYEGKKYHVIIAWRVPLERGVEADFDLDAIQKACLGTLQGAD